MPSKPPTPDDQPTPAGHLTSASIKEIFEGHLHPLTLLFGLWKGIRGAIPVIPLLFFGNRLMGAGILILIFLSTILTALVRYFSFSYRIEARELITRQGILQRKQRNIPLERVQEIRIEQGVIHRLFNVVDAKIETGGGEGAEATLSVLSRAEAERLRHAVFERAAAIKAGTGQAAVEAIAEPAIERRIIRRLGVKELILAGVTSNHIVSALVLAGAIWNFADDIFPDTIYQRAAQYMVQTTRQVMAYGVLRALVIVLFGFVVVFIIGAFFSMIGSIVLFYGFTFSLRGEDLQRNYGLLTRRASSLPRRRIQVLEIEEKMLRRLFGWATLRADTSGSRRENEDDNEGRDVLIPILRRREVDPLMPIFFRDFDQTQSEWRRVSKLAIRRGTIKGGAVCLIATIALGLYRQDPGALSLLVLLPLIYLISLLRYRNLGYVMGERYFQTRRGWLGRSTHIVPVDKIQAVEIRQSPFDRRLGLATLSIDTAGQAYTGGGPEITNLPLGEAKQIAGRLAHQASITRYRW